MPWFPHLENGYNMIDLTSWGGWEGWTVPTKRLTQCLAHGVSSGQLLVKCHGIVPAPAACKAPQLPESQCPQDPLRCVGYSVHRNFPPPHGSPCGSSVSRPLPGTSRAHFSGRILELRGVRQPAGVAPGPAERATTHLSRCSGPEQRPAAALALAVRTGQLSRLRLPLLQLPALQVSTGVAAMSRPDDATSARQ